MSAVSASHAGSGERIFRWLVWAGISLGILFLLILILFATGRVAGYEFCPQTFEYRELYYYRLPWFGLQVSPPFREPKTLPGVIQDLNASQRFPVAAAARWDMVEVGRSQTRGDAHFLRQYLELRDPETGADYWIQWNHEHPQLVSTFWNALVKLARDGQYVRTAELFELAMQTPATASHDQFQRQLVELVRSIDGVPHPGN